MGGGQGPHLHEQDFGRTIRDDTGEREWGAQRIARGRERGLGRLHPHDRESEKRKKTRTPREGWESTARRHHTGILIKH